MQVTAYNIPSFQRNWQIDLTGAKVVFKRKGEEKMEIPKQRLIAASLAYARELEQIV
jgi:26S proteasome regulatory subunit N12